MAQVRIESVPPGARVTLDGRTYTTPARVSVDEESPPPSGGSVAVDAFRSECMSNGSVSCDWSVLKQRLEDQTVKNIWWDLTKAERHAIADRAVLKTDLFRIRFSNEGKDNCAGIGPTWRKAVCLHNACIKYSKFIGPIGGGDKCYWKHYEDDEPECYLADKPYNLPGANVHIITPIAGPGFGHALVAIRLDRSAKRIDDWYIFQYGERDIQLNNWQLPVNKHSFIRIEMCVLDYVCNNCSATGLTKFMRWDFHDGKIDNPIGTKP